MIAQTTIESSELIERWSNAERVLHAMTPHERERHWDMGTWGEITECGTVACAAGRCGLDPWFRERGFALEFSGTRAKQPDVSTFFGVEGSTRIFFDPTLRPVETVIEEVHCYVAELQKLATLGAGRDVPRIGEDWPEQGGVYAGPRLGTSGAPDYLLIVGPECDDALTWREATEWAAALSIAEHRDFVLPSRPEGLALFDHARPLFQREWYWLGTQHASNSHHAWYQYFSGGGQGSWLKGYELRARAVRRLSI